jgi:hypothetical protein
MVSWSRRLCDWNLFRLQHKWKHSNRRTGVVLLLVGQLSCSVSRKLQSDKFQSAKRVDISFRRNVSKHLSSGSRVTSNTVNAAFANFDASRCQLNQSLKKATDSCVCAGDSPELFPLFMSFPIEAKIEKVESEQVVAIGGPVFGT